MKVILYKCRFFMKKVMVQILDRPDKMSDSNDTLPDINKFLSDIFRCPTVILSLAYKK